MIMRRVRGITVLIALVVFSAVPSQAQFGNLVRSAKKVVSKVTGTEGTSNESGATNADARGVRSSAAASASPAGEGSGKTWYVSKNAGNNRNDGSKASPLKNLQKAIDMAAPGDNIYCAAGNYIGQLDKGFVEISKPVHIYGGYSEDFSSRDWLKYRSTVIVPSDKNMTARGKAPFQLKDNMPAGNITVDGFIFDNGESNFYKPQSDESCPPGCLTGRVGGVGEGNPPSTFDPFIKGVVPGFLTVRNCAFVNNTFTGVQCSAVKGVTVDNCIFVALQMSAVECWNRLGKQPWAEVVVKNCTILFMWPRTKTFETMGYGVRWRSGSNITVERNVIGCCYMGGIDFGHTSNLRGGETSTIRDNLFFANTGGDMCVPAGNSNFLHIFAEDFGDVDQITTLGENKTLKDPQNLKNVIDKSYLEGYLNASSKKSNNFDRNSPNNQFRAALGMNLDGGVEKVHVSMFNSRYPLEKALELFGAVKGYGAQR